MEEYLHKELTEKIIGAAMEVHRQLGPGFLEGVYEEALAYELTSMGLTCEKQKEFEIHYKGVVLLKDFDVIWWWTAKSLWKTSPQRTSSLSTKFNWSAT